MSDHEKLYGVCENKCFVEVRPKSDTYSKDDVNQLMPKFEETDELNGSYQTQAHDNDTFGEDALVMAPEGFSSQNCMAVLFVKFKNQPWEQAFNRHQNYESQIFTFQCKWELHETLGENVRVKIELHDFDGAVSATSLFPVKLGVLFVPFN